MKETEKMRTPTTVTGVGVLTAVVSVALNIVVDRVHFLTGDEVLSVKNLVTIGSPFIAAWLVARKRTPIVQAEAEKRAAVATVEKDAAAEAEKHEAELRAASKAADEREAEVHAFLKAVERETSKRGRQPAKKAAGARKTARARN